MISKVENRFFYEGVIVNFTGNFTWEVVVGVVGSWGRCLLGCHCNWGHCGWGKYLLPIKSYKLLFLHFTEAVFFAYNVIQ